MAYDEVEATAPYAGKAKSVVDVGKSVLVRSLGIVCSRESTDGMQQMALVAWVVVEGQKVVVRTDQRPTVCQCLRHHWARATAAVARIFFEVHSDPLSICLLQNVQTLGDRSCHPK